jgi:glycosyltransferase involved in cell wall biosynthesis
MKKTLLFYPHNFLEMSSGTHRRFYEIAEYLKSRNHDADLLTLDGFTNSWDEASLARGKVFFNNIYICRWKAELKKRIAEKISSVSGKPALSDFATSALRSVLRQLLKKNSYHIFLNSYVYWEKLADEFPANTVKCIDIHDLITLNEHMRSGSRDFRLGRMFQQEINAINKYDYAFSISEEEMLLLQPFCSRAQFINIPVTFKENFSGKNIYKFDAIFVGSDNPFNKQGIVWFLNKVYPLLPRTMTFAVVGKVARDIEAKPNLALIPFAENLDAIYDVARMVICPILGGTGLKVKVVEALAHGKPLVTTPEGLSGILQKNDNGCIVAHNPEAFAKAMIRLASDQQHYSSVLKEGRTFFLEKFSRNASWKKLDGLFDPLSH